MKSYYVTIFGDICIEQVGNDVELKTCDLTIHEKDVLSTLLSKRCKLKIEDLDNRTIKLEGVKLSEIHKDMKKALKNDKPTMTVLKLKNGKLELIEELSDKDDEKATDVVTVDRPQKHCPMPEITKQKEIRAQEILKKFLIGNQFSDFMKTKSFISIGNWSKKPYIITSRWSPKVSEFGQIYDVVDERAICAICTEIPPAEEMLSMKLSIELREKEFLETPTFER